ncbi:MAG: serine hydrolase domain-containing protein [bacterium]
MHIRNYTFVLVYGLISGLFLSCEKDTTSTDTENEQLINRLEAAADSIVAHTHVPGIVALVNDNEHGIEWVYATGLSDIENNIPTNVNHTFRIGSNTKTMVGTVLLQLVDDGEISLDDKLSVYFPGYLKADSVSIRMLANMSSGIGNYTENDEWVSMILADPQRVWQPEELVDYGFSLGYYFEPGTGFHYSNTNTILLGMIIEELTGNSLQEEIEDRIFEPLDLNQTGFLTTGVSLPGTHGKGYYFGQYEPGEESTEFIDVSWAWAAGSTYSTVSDLQKYVERLVEGGFLSDELQEERLTDLPVVSTTPERAYGLCLLRYQSFYGHNGGIFGYTSSMVHSREHDCSVIIWYNCHLQDDGIHPDQLLYEYIDILFGE